MSLSRRLVAGSSVVVLVAGLAACTGSAAPPASAPTSEAPTATSAATPTQTPTPTPTPTPTAVIELTADTLVDAMVAAHGGAQTWTFSALSASDGDRMTLTGRASGGADGATAFALTINVPDSPPVELRLVDGVCYMNGGDETQGKFVAFDPTAADSPMAVADIVDSITPTAGIEEVRPAVVSVTKAGPIETLDGVPTQPFDVVIDSTKVTGQLADQFKADRTTPKTLTYRFWFGADGLVRKTTYDLPGEHEEFTYGWGKPVEIQAPAADQILDLG